MSKTITTPSPLVGEGWGEGVTTYAYNLDKDLTLVTRPDNATIAYDYDAGGRLASMTSTPSPLVGEGGGEGVSYTYDSAGRLSAASTSGGNNLAYTYDGSLLKSVAWTGATAGTIGYTYNNDFRVATETVNNANSVAYGYDADGLLTSAGLATLTRSAQTGLVQAAAVSNASTAYTYSGFGELSRRTDSYAGAAFLDASYTRDAAGRITQKTETSGATTHVFGYTYDVAGRLTEVTKDGTTSATYTYDANGNRVSFTPPLVGGAGGGGVSATYDAQDRLLTYGNNNYTYTANGELASKTDATGVTSYTYDALGNLTKVVLLDGKFLEYIVDGAGRRIAKKVNGVITKGFLYEGSLRVAAELDATGAVVSRFVYATGVNVPEYMVRGGATYRIITDHLGSVRMVIDVATGSVAQEMQYDEFGVVTLDTNPGFTPFGFAGGLYDPDTRLVRFGARDYDAETGRWTAKDPIGFNGGDTNLYGYVLGDPVNWVDVAGLSAAGSMAESLVLIPEVVIVVNPVVVGAGVAIGVVLYPSDIADDNFENALLSKGGQRNVKDTELAPLSDAEISAGARDKTLPKCERERYKTEEKARRLRNRKKRTGQ